MKRIILASASPRRKAILEEMGIKAGVIPAGIDESLPAGRPPREAAVELARRKARSAAEFIRRSSDEPYTTEAEAVIIAADTIVLAASNGGREEVIGKPGDDRHAAQILRRLSGSTHSVVTGLCVIDTAAGRELCGWDETRLTMRPMTGAEIQAYVESGEAHGKAGAYGLQENDPYVTDISGSYTNVLGLPVELLRRFLSELDVITADED